MGLVVMSEQPFSRFASSARQKIFCAEPILEKQVWKIRGEVKGKKSAQGLGPFCGKTMFPIIEECRGVYTEWGWTGGRRKRQGLVFCSLLLKRPLVWEG